jgi:hypothetical protein
MLQTQVRAITSVPTTSNDESISPSSDESSTPSESPPDTVVSSPAPSQYTMQPTFSTSNVSSAQSPIPLIQTQAPTAITPEAPSIQNAPQTSNQNKAPILSIFNDSASITAPPSTANEELTNTSTSSWPGLAILASLFLCIASIV